MKKILIVLLLLFFPLTLSARDTGVSVKLNRSSGNVINDGTGVTTFYGNFADGSAFVYFDVIDVSDYIGKQVELTDSGGKVATGYIKAVDSADSYGSELAPDNNCTSTVTEADATTGWIDTGLATFESITEGSEPSSYSLHCIADSSSDSNRLSLTTATGALYEISFYYKVASGKNVRVLVGTAAGSSNIYGDVTNNDTTWTQQEFYISAETTTTWLQLTEGDGSNDSEWWVDDFSVKEITALDGGIQIVSTSGGSTRNWEDIESGFDYNNISSMRILQVVEY